MYSHKLLYFCNLLIDFYGPVIQFCLQNSVNRIVYNHIILNDTIHSISYTILILCNIVSDMLHSQFSSVSQSCQTLYDPMNRSTPGLPVHHQLPEFAQTHAHRVSDAIQPSHPLLAPSPPAPKPSQHQSLFRCVSSSH